MKRKSRIGFAELVRLTDMLGVDTEIVPQESRLKAKLFLDLEVGDYVACRDEYSHDMDIHVLKIDSVEEDMEYATETNPTGRRYFGTDQSYLDENGEFNEGDHEYLTVIDESNFCRWFHVKDEILGEEGDDVKSEQS